MRLLMIILFAIAASAETRAQTKVSPMEDAGKENLPAQRLGIDDLIGVSVYDAPELTRSARVEPDGTIRLPLLEDGVKAAGLLPRELETTLAAALKRGEILVNPVVKITVIEYHSRPVSVMGAVRKPLTFQAVGTVTLLDALARAEGLTDQAGTEIVVTQDDTVERVPVKQLMNEADSSVNFLLHGGEQIRVPAAGKIFVAGNVRKPGAFPVRDGTENSVIKLVALAEGLAPYAYKQAFVYRLDASGARQEMLIELDKILQRKAPDVPLQVDDVLYIPDSKGKRLTTAVLDRIAGFGSSTASGLVIFH